MDLFLFGVWIDRFPTSGDSGNIGKGKIKMKNGKYGFFVAAIVMLALALVGVALFTACCIELASDVSDGTEAAFAAIIMMFIGALVGANVFCASALGFLFSALAIKRAERRAYRVTSTVLCILNAVLAFGTLLPTLYMIFLMTLG